MFLWIIFILTAVSVPFNLAGMRIIESALDDASYNLWLMLPLLVHLVAMISMMFHVLEVA